MTSPLDYFLDLFGFEQAMVGLLEDPGRAAAILDRFTDGIVAIAEGLAASGVDAVKISSPFAGAGFLSTAFYRTFVLPYESRIARAAEARGVRSYIHTCGDIHDRLELMAGSGASGIECLDPPPLGRVDLADAKARVGTTDLHQGQRRSGPRPPRRRSGLGPGRRPPAAGRGQARRPLYPELGLLDRPPHAGRERPGPGRGRRDGRRLLS